jgi:hypothetical protein
MSLGRNANAGMNNYTLKTLFLFLVLGLAACKAPRPAAPVTPLFPPTTTWDGSPARDYGGDGHQ